MARRTQAQLQQSYRAHALKMFPWICAHCGRECAGKTLIAGRWLVTDDSGRTSETGVQGGSPPASQLAFPALCACLATFAPAINRMLFSSRS